MNGLKMRLASVRAPVQYFGSQGVALVSVLLMLAVMVTLLTYMVESQYLSVRQTNLQQFDELSVLENSHAEAWGQSVLTKPNEDDYAADQLADAWATTTFENKDGFLKTASIVDLQGRLNLNNLVGEQQAVWLPIFRRLLDVVEVDPAIASAVVDWIDADQNPRDANGAEDLEYLSFSPARRAANQPLSSVEELLLIKGVDQAVYEKLLPHVAAIAAADIKVNMNTATLELVKSILPNGANSGLADQLVNARQESGFQTVAELQESDFLAGVGDTLNAVIDVKSQYFEMDSRVVVTDVTKKFRTGIKRELLENEVLFSIIYRKRVL